MGSVAPSSLPLSLFFVLGSFVNSVCFEVPAEPGLLLASVCSANSELSGRNMEQVTRHQNARVLSCREIEPDSKTSPTTTLADIHDTTATRNCALFADMSASDSATVLGGAREKNFQRRDTLFLEDDSVHQIILLIAGSVKITQLGVNGSEVILRVTCAGELVDAFGSFPAGNHYASGQALQYCRALVWDPPVFQALLQRFPAMQRNLLTIMSERLRELEQRFRELATEKVAARVANQLVRLLPQMGRRIHGTVKIALSREELAQMTGTTLFTISRLLCLWEGQGIVEPRREAVLICDTVRLAALGEADLDTVPA